MRAEGVMAKRNLVPFIPIIGQLIELTKLIVQTIRERRRKR